MSAVLRGTDRPVAAWFAVKGHKQGQGAGLIPPEGSGGSSGGSEVPFGLLRSTRFKQAGRILANIVVQASMSSLLTASVIFAVLFAMRFAGETMWASYCAAFAAGAHGRLLFLAWVIFKTRGGKYRLVGRLPITGAEFAEDLDDLGTWCERNPDVRPIRLIYVVARFAQLLEKEAQMVTVFIAGAGTGLVVGNILGVANWELRAYELMGGGLVYGLLYGFVTLRRVRNDEHEDGPE